MIDEKRYHRQCVARRISAEIGRHYEYEELLYECGRASHPYGGVAYNGTLRCHCGESIHNGVTRAIERLDK